jgi:GDSL/SGNH-like Acyl-Esterase family found in Pmr5 and Cas1p
MMTSTSSRRASPKKKGSDTSSSSSSSVDNRLREYKYHDGGGDDDDMDYPLKLPAWRHRFLLLGLFSSCFATIVLTTHELRQLWYNPASVTTTTRPRDLVELALGNEGRRSNRSRRTGRRRLPHPLANHAWNEPDLSFTVPGLDHGARTRPPPRPAAWRSDRLCTRPQIQAGSWQAVTLKKPPYVTPTVHLRCFEKSVYTNKRGYPTYQWQPADDCEFSPWKTSLFCSLLEYGTVLIVGDSLSWEQYASLVQLAGLKTKQGYQHQSRELNVNIQQAVCQGRTAIRYRRDDRLTNLRDALSAKWSLPTVLILNRGAHYVEDEEHLQNVRDNLVHVRAWLDTCESHGLQCHFFWRTSVPGHPHCANFTKPSNSRADMEALIANPDHYDDHSIQYHWQDYQRQNLLTMQLLESDDYWATHATIIDAYDLNVLRPDEHRAHQGDCLHNCYPGKMDVYNELLLHYLRGRVTTAQVDEWKIVSREQGWNPDITTKYDEKATEKARKRRLAKE